MVEYQFYLVSTPIGNLEDFTFRAKNILESVDLVLAEDTRRTGLILARYGIKTRLKAYHDHNKDRVTPQVIEFIESGKKAALVSDAGTPLISDPGYYLVVRLIEHGITVTAVPGPSAVITGLVLSGLPTDRFAFLGYVPRKKGARTRFIEDAAQSTMTTIFFESPFRVMKTLAEIARVMPDRRVVVAREMTKLHEEVLRGRAGELFESLSSRSLKGEITILVEGKS